MRRDRRIADAAANLFLARGFDSVGVDEIGELAGVTGPAIYRHFRSKADLLAAVYPHVAQRHGLDSLPDPTSLGDLREGIRRIFERVDALDDLARAAMASPGAAEVRHATMPGRLARIGRLADSLAGELSEDDRRRITRLLTVLTASASLRMWRDHLRSSVDQAADDIDFVIRAAIAASTRSEP
jgi:AcrR family transcriptional regulator